MTMQRAELSRQLTKAIDAVQSGNDEIVSNFISYFNEHGSESQVMHCTAALCPKHELTRCSSSVQRKVLLDLCKEYWNGTTGSHDSGHSGCMRIVLQIPELWIRSATECIECIHQELITGRSALYCISELRLALNRKSRSGSTDCGDLTVELFGLIELCLSPMLDSEKASVSTTAFAVCLELLSVLIGALHATQETEAADQALDMAFSVRWAPEHVLPLASTLSELYPFLSTEHLQSLRVSFAKDCCPHLRHFVIA
jgi:hypothetical protein